MLHDHISSLGYHVEATDEKARVKPLLDVAGLAEFDDLEHEDWDASQYLLACTKAGGTAACAGWARRDRHVILHSLAVAPPARGSGVGVGLLATAIGHILDTRPVDAIFLTTTSIGARRLFESMGFSKIQPDEVPDPLMEAPQFRNASQDATFMSRRYDTPRRGLDHCAFRLILNNVDDATLPLGSVFFFRQMGRVIEAMYRGGPVRRGHLLGAIDDGELSFVYQAYVEDGRLMTGHGTIVVDQLPDGRRELRERLSAEDPEANFELLLREV